ncbi:Cyclic nucleotide-gated ion channel like [Actinidia chinensis var. chinensis]|uniref:Cyclic nucleotide-gated ion channel like n=1 Tax=Actinidia chinensis var. chinensis TaxID=1590841 RepID=A0A2R6Q7W7_ACTCC|nr:Cyclic nucleotide-gated ion channel like [Actinidia chinensis var. chinensis]
MNLNRDKFVRFQNSPSEGSSSFERQYSTQDGPWISRRSILGSVVGSTRRGFEKVSKGIQNFRISLGNHRQDSRPTQELGSGKKILDPQAPFLQGWNKIFVITCVIAVSLDPLFFYVPVINGVRKCLTLDKGLEIITCVLRSFFDIFYVLHILFQFRTGFIAPSSRVFGRGELVKDSRAIAKKYLSSYFIVDVLAILPLPQLVIFTLQTNASVTLATKESLKAVIFCQYVPRLIRIYPLIKEVNRTSGIFAETAWAAAAFNLFLYMLASNVVGAFWYLLTIERQDRCWNDVCAENCDSLYCESGTEANTFLNDSCRLLEPNEIKNPEDFDFGIFLDALKSRIVEERDFPRKFFYCFWWGLRSLSSLGQNLKTSTFVGEVLFAAFISILGLVLFSLLIGNMQKYLQSINVRVEEMRVKRRDAEQWMSHRMLPENLKERIRRYEQYKWQETRGVEEETLIRNLPKDIRRDIKRHLCWSLLKRVPMFDKMDQQLLDAMCDRLKPVLYTQTSFIVREGDPVDEMLFVMRGNLLTMTTNGGRTGFFNSVFLTAGDFCGEELLTWALDPNSSSSLPSSTRTAKAITDVEAFALGAEDLKFVASQFRRRLHSKQIQHAFRFYSQQWRTWGACFIQVAWRRYCRRKIEKSLREEEDRLQDALANEFGSSPSLGATLYAAKFAANALRAIRRNHAPSPKLPRRLPNLLLQKPSEPDFASEDL